MSWSVSDLDLLSTVPLIQLDEYSIEDGDVEFRNGKYILSEDDSMSLTCLSSELRIKEIMPNREFEYELDQDGAIDFNGSNLEGDRYGNLHIGIFWGGLEYPLKVIKFELTAPFSVKGEVDWQVEDLIIRKFRASNAPSLESNHYPYRLEYNTSTADAEENWESLPIIFEGPDDFRYTTPRIESVPEEISTAYENGLPVRIRLISARGKTFGFRAICKRKEIIRVKEPSLTIPVVDWIGYPKTLNILHEKYRFDETSMEESWVEFPKLELDSVIDWFPFQQLEFETRASMKLLDCGQFIEFELVFDIADSKELIDHQTEFFLSLEPSIGGKDFKFQDLKDFTINKELSKIAFLIRQPLPRERIEFNPQRTGIRTFYEYEEGHVFYSNSPFSKMDWDLYLILKYKKTPGSHLHSEYLVNWTDPLVSKNENKMKSRVHPNNFLLYQSEFKRLQPNRGVFCIECGELGFPSGGIFKCEVYKCGWSNENPVCTGYNEVRIPWFDYHGKSSDGLHSFSLNTGRLNSGEYIATFNGMSFHFDVS